MSVQPKARFGALGLQRSSVCSFQEKPNDEGGWINGGFFVISRDPFAICVYFALTTEYWKGSKSLHDLVLCFHILKVLVLFS